MPRVERADPAVVIACGGYAGLTCVYEAYVLCGHCLEGTV